MDSGVSVFDLNGSLFVDGAGSLEHQEHTAIPVPPGIYEGIRQREYSPASIRNVAD